MAFMALFQPHPEAQAQTPPLGSMMLHCILINSPCQPPWLELANHVGWDLWQQQWSPDSGCLPLERISWLVKLSGAHGRQVAPKELGGWVAEDTVRAMQSSKHKLVSPGNGPKLFSPCVSPSRRSSGPQAAMGVGKGQIWLLWLSHGSLMDLPPTDLHTPRTW